MCNDYCKDGNTSINDSNSSRKSESRVKKIEPKIKETLRPGCPVPYDPEGAIERNRALLERSLKINPPRKCK